MKRNVVFLLFVTAAVNGLSAQEMQLSAGPEFGYGVFKVNNDYGFIYGLNPYLIQEKTTSSFFAPGISFSVRVFPDMDSRLSTGFVFRDSVLFATHYKRSGTAGGRPVSETLSAVHDDFFAAKLNFDLGYSSRIIISERLRFYSDLGINLTYMDAAYEGDTLNYWGFGIFACLALQVNLKKTMYLEFGINTAFNAFSSQEGTFHLYGQKIDYEDSGRWDMPVMAAYIHIGWRLDLQKLRSMMNGEKAPQQ